MRLLLLQNDSPPLRAPPLASVASSSTASADSAIMSNSSSLEGTLPPPRVESAIVRARFEPDVAGVNRYKHFHRPMLSSPLHFQGISILDGLPDDGQSIDKTSPRRRKSHNRVLLPLNGSATVLPSIHGGRGNGLLLEDRGIRPRAKSNGHNRQGERSITLKNVNMNQMVLPSILFGQDGIGSRRSNSSIGIVKASIDEGRGKSIEVKAATTNGYGNEGGFGSKHRKEAKMMENKQKVKVPTTLDELTTVKVRRRIIISDSLANGMAHKKEKKEPVPLVKNASMDSSSSSQPVKPIRRKPPVKKIAKKVIAESVSTQTESEEVSLPEPQNSLQESAMPRATQTETNCLFNQVTGMNSHRSSTIGPDELEQRTQLLAIIDRALDETIDRESRLRTNEFIAYTARNQAQIWRDSKEFVALHLLPRSIELANRTRQHSRDGSLRSYEKALRSIQLP